MKCRLLTITPRMVLIKKNLQTVLHVPFVVVAIYYEKMHKLIIIKHQAKHVFISSAYLFVRFEGRWQNFQKILAALLRHVHVCSLVFMLIYIQTLLYLDRTV